MKIVSFLIIIVISTSFVESEHLVSEIETSEVITSRHTVLEVEASEVVEQGHKVSEVKASTVQNKRRTQPYQEIIDYFDKILHTFFRFMLSIMNVAFAVLMYYKGVYIVTVVD